MNGVGKVGAELLPMELEPLAPPTPHPRCRLPLHPAFGPQADGAGAAGERGGGGGGSACLRHRRKRSSLPTQALHSPASGSVSAAAVARYDGGRGEDRISRLADALLSDIVSLLPAKDVARTAALSPGVWAGTPLVLDDAHLLPDQPNGLLGSGTDWRAVADAVSLILDAHLGPFRCVRLTHVCNYAAAHSGGELARSASSPPDASTTCISDMPPRAPPLSPSACGAGSSSSPVPSPPGGLPTNWGYTAALKARVDGMT